GRGFHVTIRSVLLNDGLVPMSNPEPDFFGAVEVVSFARLPRMHPRQIDLVPDRAPESRTVPRDARCGRPAAGALPRPARRDGWLVRTPNRPAPVTPRRSRSGATALATLMLFGALVLADGGARAQGL